MKTLTHAVAAAVVVTLLIGVPTYTFVTHVFDDVAKHVNLSVKA